jgi:hypothetical protein
VLTGFLDRKAWLSAVRSGSPSTRRVRCWSQTMYQAEYNQQRLFPRPSDEIDHTCVPLETTVDVMAHTFFTIGHSARLPNLSIC